MGPFLLLTLLMTRYVLCKGPGSGESGDDNHGGLDSNTSPTSGSLLPATPTTGHAATSTSSTESPMLRFTSPDNTTECTSITFYWTATKTSGPVADESISLLVTNQGVPRYTPVTSVVRVLSSDVPKSAQHFVWLPVDVASGWYTVQAQSLNQTILSYSSAFFVRIGTNNSCLRVSHSSVHPSYKRLGSHAHVSKAELIGIVVGSIAGLTTLCMAFAFPQFWRHALVSPKTQRKHPYRKIF